MQNSSLQSIRLLIKGGGFSNKGDEAMMRTAQRELARRIPGASFVIRIPTRQADLAHAAGFAATIIERSRLKKAWRLARWLVRSSGNSRLLATSRVTALEIADLGDVDGVIDI